MFIEGEKKPLRYAVKLKEYCPGLSYFSYRVTCCSHFAIFHFTTLFSLFKFIWLGDMKYIHYLFLP